MSVNNAAKTTSGCWSFADFFSYVIRMIAQKGRRGALIITLDVHHPDVEKFARMKADLKKVTGANVSIRLSDEFLQAVEDDVNYEQRWPCEGTPVMTQMVSARKVWNTIKTNACENAEPGLIFWDRMVNRLPAHSYPQFKTRSTNPCSEIGLSAYDSCRLISLNLTGYTRNAFTNSARFDFDFYKQDVITAMQMVDNLVDLELELVSRIKDVCDTASEKDLWQKLWQSGYEGRRTGLGTHGLADMLAQLNIRYDSDEALEFVDGLYTVHRDTAYGASIDLAEQRGAFPAFDWEIEKNNEYIQDLPEHLKKRMTKVGRRNISILTQAPTGSVSLLSKCGEFKRHNISSGIEPVFRNNYTRRKRVNANDGISRIDFTDAMGDTWQNFEVYHGNVLNYMEKTFEIELSDIESDESQAKLAEFRGHLPNIFATSDEIDWEKRVKLQGIIQDKVDHSISSTINLPKGTTPDIVGDIYLQAWKSGLKGVTVYVDGSRSGVLLTKDDEKIDPKVRPKKVVRIMAPKRPKELPCEIHHHQVKGEKWTAIVGLLDGEPYEMFGGYSRVLSLPKKYKNGTLRKRSKGKYSLHMGEGDDELIIRDVIGTFDNPELAWVTRLVSVSMRHATPVEFLVDQLSKEGKINSFNKVLARVLKKYIPDGEKVKSNEACEKCKGPNLVWSEGCKKCLDCAEQKCNV
jgi:ribonucleoside-diphosphate reductase alpha chain